MTSRETRRWSPPGGQGGAFNDARLPDLAEMMLWIEGIVSRGVRRPGYEADRWTEQWAAEMFRSLGLEDVALEPVELPIWEPLGPASLDVWSVADPGVRLRIEGFALPHSRPVPEGSEREVVEFGSGAHGPGSAEVSGNLAVTELELLRLPTAGLRDNATFAHDPDKDFDSAIQILPFGPNFMNVMEPAIAAGAAGFVGALTGVPWDTCNYYVPYDAVERPIPGIWISRSQSNQLLSLVRASPVRGCLTSAANRLPTTTHNVLGTLRGSSDEWIVIASHHDGPWASAVEDASGISLVLAQARYWSQVPANQRPHNLLFLLTSGHMAGGAGTKAFVEHHEDLISRIVLELHLEHAARECTTSDGALVPTDVPEPRWWFTSRNSRLESLVQESIVAEDMRRSLVLRPDIFFENPPTDGAFFHAAGVPIVHYLSAPMYLFDSQDTIDKIHTDTLIPLSRAVVRIVDATREANSETFRRED